MLFTAVIERGVVRYYAKVFIARNRGRVGHESDKQGIADISVSEDSTVTPQYQFLAECLVPLSPGAADPSQLNQKDLPHFENSQQK